MNDTIATIRVYHGYGHKDNLVVYGHALVGKRETVNIYTDKVAYNIIHLIKLFFVRPLPGVRLQLHWGEQRINTLSEVDGFFRFEWQSDFMVSAGWHPVSVHLVDQVNEHGTSKASGVGKVFVPHSTQYGFISDIDDTVLVSHSAATGKKLRVLFTKNPRSRKTFADVVKFYRLLAHTHTEPDVPNPFFYVSSSEWNLYDYLNEFFKHHGLPKGVFLLNKIKRWYQLAKTGKPKQPEKLARIERILQAFPKQRFILLGDNSQHDPQIYVSIANQYPDRIVAIYLRYVTHKRERATEALLASIQNQEIQRCIFKHTDDAISHARAIGLIV